MENSDSYYLHLGREYSWTLLSATRSAVCHLQQSEYSLGALSVDNDALLRSGSQGSGLVWAAVLTENRERVGYGDMYPETWVGKIVASVLVFVSMVYLALPMTIIVSKFNKAFEKFKPESEKREAEQAMREKRMQHSSQQQHQKTENCNNSVGSTRRAPSYSKLDKIPPPGSELNT
eukprot:sb/3471893/